VINAGAGDSEALSSMSHLEELSSKLIANHLSDRRPLTADKNFPPYTSLFDEHLQRSSSRATKRSNILRATSAYSIVPTMESGKKIA